MKKILGLVVVAMGLSVVGCAPNLSPDVYSADEMGTASHVLKATVVSMRPIIINNESGVGGLAGTVAGGAAGSMIGGNDATNVIGAVGGAVVGGVIGSAVDKSSHQQQGIEYMLRLENGKMVAVTQLQSSNLKVGQSVLLICGTRVRVVPDTTVETVSKHS